MQNPTEALFTLALNLTPPWTCMGVDFSKEDSRLDIVIDFPRGSRFACPECGATGLAVHDTVEKQWRHLDFFQHICYLHARVPRISCPEHGVRLVAVPWARPGSGFTLLYEALVLALVPQMSVKGVARQMQIHDTQLWRVIHHYVSEARDRVEYHTVRSLAVDETSARKGHRYVTVFADPEEKRVVYATEGKDKATIGRFVEDFHAHNGDADAVREVCMDMSPAFIEGAREALPNARLTFDRFHVMQLASRAMDDVRRSETAQDTQLKGSRYLWLHRPEHLSERQTALLERHLGRNQRMSNAYSLVLDLRTFYEVEKATAQRYLMWWYYRACRSRLAPFRRLAQTIKEHIRGVLNYHRARSTNGFLEGLNGKIQTTKRIARGYRSSKNLITMIYLIGGKLPISLPT